MSTIPIQQPRSPIVPRELGGKWIAWTLDGSRIVAFGDTLDDCEAATEKAAESNLRFEKAPRADVRIIGSLNQRIPTVLRDHPQAPHRCDARRDDGLRRG